MQQSPEANIAVLIDESDGDVDIAQMTPKLGRLAQLTHQRIPVEDQLRHIAVSEIEDKRSNWICVTPVTFPFANLREVLLGRGSGGAGPSMEFDALVVGDAPEGLYPYVFATSAIDPLLAAGLRTQELMSATDVVMRFLGILRPCVLTKGFTWVERQADLRLYQRTRPVIEKIGMALRPSLKPPKSKWLIDSYLRAHKSNVLVERKRFLNALSMHPSNDDRLLRAWKHERVRVVICAYRGEIQRGGEVSVANFLESIDPTMIEPILVCPERGSLYDLAKRRGVDTHIAPIRPVVGARIQDSWKQGQVLAEICKDSKADLLFAANLPITMPAIIAARIATVPIVSKCIELLPWKSLDTNLAQFATRYVAVSNAVSRWYESYGIPKSAIRVIYEGIPLDRFLQINDIESRVLKTKAESNHIKFGALSAISQIKGLTHLIEAMSKVVKALPYCTLDIAGREVDTDYSRRLREMVSRLGLTGHVRFQGYVRDNAEFYDSIDVMIISSLSEALPLTLMESAAAGLPIVATSVGGIPEVIEDGLSGILVEPANASSLANAMISIASNRGLRASLADHARSLALARFDVKCQVSELTDFLRSIIWKRMW